MAQTAEAAAAEMDAAIATHRIRWAKKTDAQRERRIEELYDALDDATVAAEETDDWDRVCEITWELEALGETVG